MLILAPWWTAPFPPRLLLGDLLGLCRVSILNWLHHHRGGHPTLDAHERETQKPKPRDDFAIEGREKPIQAMRRLARFRRHHVIACRHDHIVCISQMGTNQQPLELAPAERGVEKALHRAVTAPLAGPA